LFSKDWIKNATQTATRVFACATLLGNINENAIKEKHVDGVKVLVQSLRSAGASIDIVCLVTGGLTKEQHYNLSKWVHAVDFHSELPAPVGIQDNSFHQINRAKVVLWTLVTYEKVICIDADSIVTENPDHLFSELDGDFHMSPGFGVPALGNWFMLRPSLQAFHDMRSIVQTQRWTPDNGWLDCAPPEPGSIGAKVGAA
jgi:hypothetical protein